MSLVDSIFSGIPGPLISQFGISAVYIKAQQTQEYDPLTGTFRGPIDYATGQPALFDQEISVKVLITELQSKEMKPSYQVTDVKILLSADSLNGYFPRITDSVRYTQDGVSRTAEIIDMIGYRGDNPIMYKLVGRLG